MKEETKRYHFQSGKVFEADADRESDNLERALNDTTNGIVVDLSNVTYLSIEGLAAIIKVHEIAKKSDRKIAVTGIESKQIRELLDYTQMRKYLNVYETPEEAEEAIRG